MKNQLQNYNQVLVKRIVNFLWRQWGRLGVSASVADQPDGRIIDPEALLLLSATYARHDPRLFDEIMDWLAVNSNVMNIPRLKSALRKYEFAGHDVVSVMLERVALEKKGLNWKQPPGHSVKDCEGLFLDTGGNPLPDFGPHDDIFLKGGFKRGKVALRGLSREFNPIMPECALLRLRALFGITARADIMAYLLTHNHAHPSGIARDTGFSQKNIQDTIVDMSASGFISVQQLEGRMKYYIVHERYRSLFLGIEQSPELKPRWFTWLPVFRALEILLIETRRIQSGEFSDLMLASSLRDIMEQIRPLLDQEGASGVFSEVTRYPGSAYVPVFINETESWISKMLSV